MKTDYQVTLFHLIPALIRPTSKRELVCVPMSTGLDPWEVAVCLVFQYGLEFYF